MMNIHKFNDLFLIVVIVSFSDSGCRCCTFVICQQWKLIAGQQPFFPWKQNLSQLKSFIHSISISTNFFHIFYTPDKFLLYLLLFFSYSDSLKFSNKEICNSSPLKAWAKSYIFLPAANEILWVSRDFPWFLIGWFNLWHQPESQNSLTLFLLSCFFQKFVIL